MHAGGVTGSERWRRVGVDNAVPEGTPVPELRRATEEMPSSVVCDMDKAMM